MYDAHCKSTGGYVAGEVKLAITIILLGGGDSYDLSVIFDVHFYYVNMILNHVLFKQVIQTRIGDLNIEKYIGDKDAVVYVSGDFPTFHMVD